MTLHLFILLCGRRTEQFQSAVLWLSCLLCFHLVLISLTLVSSVVSVSITATDVIHCISRPIRRTFFSPEKCDLNSTCVLCAEGKYYFQTYKYLYIYYTTSLSWDSEICFQIMRSGITACEQLTFLSGDLPQCIHCITCDSGYLRFCSSKV